MNKIFSLIAAAALTTGFMTASASASEGAYVGVKTGSFSTDVDGLDFTMPLGFQAGYDFGNGFGIEGEYNTADLDVAGIDGELTNMALYGYVPVNSWEH